MRCLRTLVVLASSSAALAACGSSGSAKPGSDAGTEVVNADTTPDATPLPVDAGYPAITPTDVPQVVSERGPVLQAPRIVPVFFAKDAPSSVALLTDFVSKVGHTQYWAAVGTEYGVGAASSGDPIQLAAEDDPPASWDDLDIQAWLKKKLNGDNPRFGSPDGNTVFALFYPEGTTITLGGTQMPSGDGGLAPDGGRAAQVAMSCSNGGFGGYHDNIALDVGHGYKKVAYAVVPRCAVYGDLYGLDAVTATASHELIEAATDPYPNQTVGAPAFTTVDDAHFFWSSALGGGEVGDLCAQDPASFVKFAELPDYYVQRSWSNKAVLAGQDPCVPALADQPYFNSFPVFNDTVALTFGGQTLNSKGVKIAAGQSGVVELDLSSTGPTSGPWTVSAIDSSAIFGGPAQLSFDFDKVTGRNGDKLMMTIHVITASRRNRETFYIMSKLGNITHTWIGQVGN